MNVLLLEDSRFDAELLGEALHAHYPASRLTVVSTEDDFVAALAHGGIDLILSDYELPGFSGAQALQLALALAPQVPFIFVSGVIGEDNAVEMLKRGATDYVSKSRLARLPLVVDRALREVAQRDAQGRAEARLREAGSTFASVVDALRDYAVMLLDTDGVVQSWNRAAHEVFGYKPEQIIGRSAQVLFTPEDRSAGSFAAELRSALVHGKADDDRWMLRADGTRLWAEGVLSPLYAEGGRHSGYCKVVHDATVAYQDAQALRAAKEEAERANHAKDRFLAVLSHELRTPLTPIASAAHVLEQCAVVPERFKGLLPMIRRNVALEARLIEDLLDLTAISAGKLRLQMAAVDMHTLVRSVAEMVADAVREKRLQLALHLDAPHSVVRGDEARLQQVLWNIVRNAIKFTPDGGRIELRTASDGQHFTLRCTDSGIGIDAAALPRIFIAFEQADGEVSQRYGGLGLGLAIARGLVREHQGRIEVASEGRGHGATFTLTLQHLGHQAAAGEQGGEDGDGMGQVEGDGCRLLLVEDNRDAADALVLSLENYGYSVTHAATRAEALAAGDGGGRFDVVVTDLGLPDGSGLDVGSAYVAEKIPVIALTGFGTSQDVQRSSAAGFAGHVVKPADPARVHALVQRLLRGRSEEEAAAS